MTVHHSHRSWRQEQEREHSYANRAGDGGEIMRACHAYEERARAELDAQVRRPSEIPCAACRRPTPIPELRGRPGRLVCTACEAPAPEPEPQPNPGAEAPQPEESTMPSTTREEREERRQRVLELRREGLTHAEIAEQLGTAQSTINNDLQRLAEAGEELPPNLTPPGRQPDEELHAAIRELIAQGVAHGEIVRQTGASRAMVSRVIRDAKGLPPYPSKEGKHLLRAEIEQLRNTLRETEEGAAELLEELERLREQLAARNLEDLAAREHHGATTPAVQREIEELRAQLAAAEEAARRPPEARRAEVERLELEIEALRRREVELELEIKSNSEAAIARLEEAEERRLTLVRALEAARLEAEGLRAQLAVNPYRRAWDALTAYNHAQVSLERARERAAEAAAELEDAEAALLPWSALNGAEVPQ